MLGRDPGVPVLVTPAVLDARLPWRRREKIGALPTHLRTEAGATLLQLRVQRRAAKRPCALEFTVWPRHLVVHAEHLGDPIGQPAFVAVEARETADVDRPKIERRLAGDDPFGERLAGATAGRDSHRIEAAADIEVVDARRRTEDEVVVRSERLGAVVELLEPRGLERRHTDHRVVEQDLERVPVVAQELELEVFGNAAAVFCALQPRSRLRLEPAHQQAADFFLEVDVAIGIAQHRQVAMHARDHVGDDVVVLAREEWDRDAEPTPERA